MIITKTALPRRAFLRGTGATVALPLLDAMVPALSAMPKPVPRLGFFYAPNGTFLPNFIPKEVGTSFQFTPVLRPLEPHKNTVTIISGLSNKGAENLGEGGGPHTRVHAAWLSGIRPKRTEGPDLEAGTSLDQIAAVRLRGTLNKWEDRDEGWTVEGRIPWKAFAATGGRPAPGAKWKFALCRYDYSVTLEHPETSSTAPLTRMDFHRYEDYGVLTFAGPAR